GVPARPPRPPWGRPRRLTRLRLLPEREVDRRSLLLDGLHPRTGAQRVDRLAGEQPVVGNRLGDEVHAVARLVRDTPGDEVFDQGDHRLDVLARMRID